MLAGSNETPAACKVSTTATKKVRKKRRASAAILEAEESNLPKRRNISLTVKNHPEKTDQTEQTGKKRRQAPRKGKSKSDKLIKHEKAA